MYTGLKFDCTIQPTAPKMMKVALMILRDVCTQFSLSGLAQAALQSLRTAEHAASLLHSARRRPHVGPYHCSKTAGLAGRLSTHPRAYARVEPGQRSKATASAGCRLW